MTARKKTIEGPVGDAVGASFAAEEVGRWVQEIQQQISTANQSFAGLAGMYGANSPASLAGFYAEAYQAHTFNINAAIHNSDHLAERLGSTAKDSPDVVTSWGEKYSLKYHKDAIHTLAHQAGGDGPVAGLHGQTRLVPGDQLDLARKIAEAKIDKSLSAAPDRASRYQETHDHLADRVQAPDGTSSKPLTKGSRSIYLTY